jgi:hypothetical protein
VSPSGDPKSSAINRLIFEHPPPMQLSVLEESPPAAAGAGSAARKNKSSMSDFFDLSDDEDSDKSAASNPSTSKSQPAKKMKRAASGSPCKDVSNKCVNCFQTKGRCYDHNFLRFLPIFGEKWRFL